MVLREMGTGMRTREQLKTLIEIYEWDLSEWSDVFQARALYEVSEREELVLADLERLAELRAELIALNS